MTRDRIQMPPRASSAGMWTPAERVGVALILAAALLTGLSIGVIVWAIARAVLS